MSEGIQRKLAAIVAADIAGYSRLVDDDEEGTLRALRAHRQDFIDPLVEQHGGRIANTAGDSLLLEFFSAVNAVRCAIAMQEGLDERNREVPVDRRIEFRIGINVGDVVAEGGDLLGDGVNVAARLEGLAAPGGIMLSDDAYRQVRDRLDTNWRDGGERQVKNIARAIRVWSWPADGEPECVAGRAETVPPPLPDKPSVAVLPFENLSGDPGEDYFSDGITEDLITALSRIRWFFVIARNSTFAYKGRNVDVREIAGELGVRYVVEGSLRKAGNRIRLTAQLVDGATGNQVWASRYDRDLDDIFELQDELTQTVVGAIEPELSKAEQARARLRKPGDLDVWDTYLRGMSALNRLTGESLKEAEQIFSRVIERDPGFGAAFSGLAEVHYYYVVLGLTAETDASRQQALEAAERAIELDREDAGAYASLGRAYLVSRRFDDAIMEFQAALEINPSQTRAHYGLGATYAFSGRSEVSLPHLEQAIRLSPHDAHMGSFLARAAHAHLNLGDYDQAIKWARKALRLPNFQWSRHIILASALGHLNRGGEAQPAIDHVLERIPTFSAAYMLDHSPIEDNADFKHLVDGLQKAGFSA